MIRFAAIFLLGLAPSVAADEERRTGSALAPVAVVHPTPPPLPAGEVEIPTGERIQEVRGWLEAEPSVFTPPARDRKAWEALRIDRLAVVKLAEKLQGVPVAPLPDALYLDFGETGRRAPFEKPFRSRLSRVATLALAEAVEYQGRFLPALSEAVEALLSEKSWVLPAHDAARGYATFHGKELGVDLAVAARAATLATVDRWLGAELGTTLRERVRSEIARRAITPYLQAIDRSGGKGFWWIRGSNNWNAVCHAGLVYAALATVEDRETRAKVVAAAVGNVRHFLNGFTPDGYCSEGLGYWNYGFGNFVFLAETVLRATSGKLDLYRHPLIGRVAAYPFRYETAPRLYPAFADSQPGGQPSRELLRQLSRRVALPFDPGPEPLLTPGRSGLGASLHQIDLRLSLPAVGSPPKPLKESFSPLRGSFPAAGVFIWRPPTPSSGLAVALKGGHNAEHHNHNDLGSYVVACDGVTVLVDPGHEVYTRRTFSSRRYESAVLNSYGHPVPLIDGKKQRSGREAYARILEVASGEEGERLVLEMASAYDVPGLQRVRRTFAYERTGATGLEVTDEIALSRPVVVETALITFGKVIRHGPSQWEVREGGRGVRVTVETGGVPFEFREEELEEKLPSDRVARRLGIRLSEPVAEARIRLRVVPLPVEERP